MAKTVVILGAGASHHARAPLMAEFLERAWDVLASGSLTEAEAHDFSLVRRGVNTLQLAHSKGDLDIWNLEAVFDAFEMASLCRCLGGMPSDEIALLPAAMRQVILKTLEHSIRVPVKQENGRPYAAAPRGYARLTEMLIRARQTQGEYPAVITFNYDICLDFALARAKRQFSYCLTGRGDGDGVRLLKLHGSMGWSQCIVCGNIVPPQHEHLLQAGYRGVDSMAGRENPECRLLVDRSRPLTCHCPSADQIEMIVPPTINKGQHHQALSKVWSAAASELREAQDIFVCGYSLPESDLFFRYLYSVGTIGEASLRRVWVFDPDPGVKPRFERLLGRQVLSQPKRFRVWGYPFEEVPWNPVLANRPEDIPNR